MNIKQVMKSAHLNAHPDSHIHNVIDLMSRHWHSCSLVGEEGKVLGIITERDIVQVGQRCIEQNQGLLNSNPLKARDIMSQPVFCLHQDTPLYEALLLARCKSLRHIPIVDDQQLLVGIVTQSDLVDAYLQQMTLNSDLEKANQELKALAYNDKLMAIGNRHGMEIDLKYTQIAAERDQAHYCIAMLDIDNFKSFNDLYGHQQGDEALKAVANALKQVKRESDRIYRFGGEEILILMTNTGIEGGLEGAERMRKAIENIDIPHAGSPYSQLTASIGVCSELAGDYEEMIKKADLALYQAKAQGRNKVLANLG